MRPLSGRGRPPGTLCWLWAASNWIRVTCPLEECGRNSPNERALRPSCSRSCRLTRPTSSRGHAAAPHRREGPPDRGLRGGASADGRGPDRAWRHRRDRPADWRAAARICWRGGDAPGLRMRRARAGPDAVDDDLDAGACPEQLRWVVDADHSTVEVSVRRDGGHALGAASGQDGRAPPAQELVDDEAPGVTSGAVDEDASDAFTRPPSRVTGSREVMSPDKAEASRSAILLPLHGRATAQRSSTRSVLGRAEQISSTSSPGDSNGGTPYEAAPDSTAVTQV